MDDTTSYQEQSIKRSWRLTTAVPRAVEHVIKAYDEARIAAGIQFGNMSLLQETQRRGGRFLLYSNDVSVLHEGYQQAMLVLKKAVQ